MSSDTPLISNLDICENISLIREVHHRLPIMAARVQAAEQLERIGLIRICEKRPTECTPFEIFYAMVIRAMMSDFSRIYILTPYSFIRRLKEFSEVIGTIGRLEYTQEIFVLDTNKNLYHYEECQCNIIR